MYVVMIDLPEKLKDHLTHKFLSLGFEIYVGENTKSVQDIIDKKGEGYLFVRINQMNSPWLTFLAHLRQYKDEGEVKYLVLSDKTDREFVQTLLLLNVASLIPGNLDQDQIYSRLNKLITSKDFHNNQRDSQRVTPREEDDISMNLSIPNSSVIITGKVVNISISGVAIQLASIGEAHWLELGQVIESAQIRINRKIGITGLKIVGIKNNMVGAQFFRQTDYFSNLLGRYLLDRISTG